MDGKDFRYDPAADKNIEYYRINARVIGAALDSMGIRYYGGKNSPYI